MKRLGAKKTDVILLLLALALVAFGLLTLQGVLRGCEELLVQNRLAEGWKTAAWKLALSGGLVVTGIGTMLTLVIHFARRPTRIQREAEALQRKNEAAEALNQQNQQLAHHQRLHIIGTLTSSIAHEFNNLLTPIMGYSMMALEKIPPEEDLYDDLLEIYNASRKAKTIISRLSDLSRKNTSTTFRQVSLDDLVHKTLDVAAPAKPPRVEVRLNLNCWEQRINANEIQLSQLLLNLILNSFDAIGDREGVLEIRTSFNDRSVELVVRDTGCGIPEEILPNIFEPFFTTKEAGKGTGLGLAIAAQMVEDHHGTIRVESRVGEGTAFTVTLPRTLEPGTMP